MNPFYGSDPLLFSLAWCSMIWSPLLARVEGGQVVGGLPMEQEQWEETRSILVEKSMDIPQDEMEDEDLWKR